MLIDRRPERAVDHADQATLLGERSGHLHVDNAQRRIRRRLQIKKPGVRPNRTLMLLVLSRIHERGLDSKLWQPLGEEFRYTAVNVALRDDVVPGLEQRQD